MITLTYISIYIIYRGAVPFASLPSDPALSFPLELKFSARRSFAGAIDSQETRSSPTSGSDPFSHKTLI